LTRFHVVAWADKTYKVPLFEGLIKGTTFSGYAIPTTFGNTWRSLAYIHYIAACAGIQDHQIKIHAAGDDVLVFIERDLAEAFRNNMHHVYADDGQSGVCGLGQISREFEISDRKFNFLSKNFVIDEDALIGNRMLHRILLSGNQSDKICPDMTIIQHRTL